ncbi:DUF4760 domain-containing protein [Vreelandella boliviensis]|uniref:Uncharacterized protein n=1 Tax=Vreelandella boliviensis LC1 TaxID=1072583 RepID=A0ABX4G4T4_9GAMM|nr:hypothetical protein [Halomonas boliviensis]OZT72518.1 hypothetical protein CE457_18990 [Halomonas boliviensis LC1]
MDNTEEDPRKQVRKKLDDQVTQFFSRASDEQGNPGIYGNKRQFKKLQNNVTRSMRFAWFFFIIIILLIILSFFFDTVVLVMPFTVMLSVSIALHIGLMQLKGHVYRAQVDHATKLAERAPDIIDFGMGFKDLYTHLHENAVHYACTDASNDYKKSPWRQCLDDLHTLAEKNPFCLAELSKKLHTDSTHGSEQKNVRRVLAFYETAAIAIRYGHADEAVLWEQFNAPALDHYIRSTPLIIAAYIHHEQSDFHRGAESLGLPYEHYETWLYWRTKKDKMLNDMVIDLRIIREQVVSSVLDANFNS